jgi:hypothetical protein
LRRVDALIVFTLKGIYNQGGLFHWVLLIIINRNAFLSVALLKCGK